MVCVDSRRRVARREAMLDKDLELPGTRLVLSTCVCRDQLVEMQDCALTMSSNIMMRNMTQVVDCMIPDADSERSLCSDFDATGFF
jgi:hypothetical protein